jgi:hypothetical protein
MTHVIYVDEAVSALELECMRWLDADADDDDDWWQKKDVWSKADATMEASMAAVKNAAPKGPMPGAPEEETAFDRIASDAAARAAEPAAAAASTAATGSSSVSFEDFLAQNATNQS